MKGLKDSSVSSASFGKCLVFNDLVFLRRAKRTGESVGLRGSARTVNQAAVASDRLGGLLRGDVAGSG